MNKKAPSFTEGPLFSNIIKFTIPIILTSILQLLFNTADLIVVGRFSEYDSLSVGAVDTTSVITNLIINLFIGLSIGAVLINVFYYRFSISAGVTSKGGTVSL